MGNRNSDDFFNQISEISERVKGLKKDQPDDVASIVVDLLKSKEGNESKHSEQILSIVKVITWGFVICIFVGVAFLAYRDKYELMVSLIQLLSPILTGILVHFMNTRK